MKNPKIGERVKVYATLNGVIAETKGRIDEVHYVAGVHCRLVVVLDTDPARPTEGRVIYAHPKQCRRLVKKARRPNDPARTWEEMLNFLVLLGERARREQIGEEEE